MFADPHVRTLKFVFTLGEDSGDELTLIITLTSWKYLDTKIHAKCCETAQRFSFEAIANIMRAIQSDLDTCSATILHDFFDKRLMWFT